MKTASFLVALGLISTGGLWILNCYPPFAGFLNPQQDSLLGYLDTFVAVVAVAATAMGITKFFSKLRKSKQIECIRERICYCPQCQTA